MVAGVEAADRLRARIRHRERPGVRHRPAIRDCVRLSRFYALPYREQGIHGMNEPIFRIAGAVCLLALAACDNTYTPSAHHRADASTGSLLSGTDTGADTNASGGDPSISSNRGVPSGGGH